MDIARAHTLSIEKQSDKFKIFNLGYGKGISILEIIKTFEKITNNKLNWKIGERRSGDVVEIYANNNLTKDSLNWEPKFSLEDMIRTSL
jgi:UDP-glucose 4-epimerase